MHMNSGLSTWNCITNKGPSLGEANSPSLRSYQLPLVLSGGETLWDFPPSASACLLLLPLLSVCLGSHIVEGP